MTKPQAVDVTTTEWRMERLSRISEISETLEGVHRTLHKLTALVTDELNALDAEVLSIVKSMRNEELQ